MLLKSFPLDIRIHIIKFGGCYHTLSISDQEILQEIHEYDPSFDISVWNKNIQDKEEFLDRVSKSPLNLFYKYLRENDISLCLLLDAFEVYTGIYNPSDIVDIITCAGYSIKEDEYYEFPIEEYTKTMFCMKDLHRMWEDLLSISFIHKQNKDDRSSYNSMKDNMSQYPYLYHICNIFHTPPTLSEYLRYQIQRKNEENRIKRMKLYNVYHMINRYTWSIYLDKEGQTHIIIREQIEDEYIGILLEELQRIFDSKVSYLSEYEWYYLTINDSELLSLINIDRFYHPYIFDPNFIT